jgi:hypothetical protein
MRPSRSLPPLECGWAGEPDPEGDDLLIEPVDPGLALGNQTRVEAAIPVARHLDLERAVLALRGGRLVAAAGHTL